ncbi:MAG: 2-C-methyl-D-erythritol 4-phosphate cytidylyltransferase [Streptosporangiaceae bacterium]|jgi:2-C-methyl-D-erythritol 4-phosphate cytidylyltransferase|nr:2-C-methyl-D-erythritol 4-phosphate cytidylyltransferase [Streptosporangiaceae bacterium]MDX6430229.1 2-C-methyl-D-erythritol 4-phosphate cytidylyltransferase [Streptosporangiaceae bacterium]
MHRKDRDHGSGRPHSVAAHMRTLAVILAGGTGQRVGSAIPKQLIEVAGRPILSYAIEAFDTFPQDPPGIDEIIVVMAPGWADAARTIAAPYGRVSAVIEGGASRTESTVRALTALAAEPDDARVLFHDAARPFVGHDVIGRCLTALESHEAVAVGMPVADTIVGVSDDLVTAMPARSGLRRFQTPQGFRLGTIRKAYELALADDAGPLHRSSATDDCGIVHRYLPDVPIPVVEGSERNLKVTHPMDVAIAEHLAGHPPL